MEQLTNTVGAVPRDGTAPPGSPAAWPLPEGVHLRAVDLERDIDELLSIERELVGALEPGRREDYLRQAGHPGRVTVGAFADDSLVGFCQAHDHQGEGWWHENVTPVLVSAGQSHWMDQALEVREIQVRADWRGKGLNLALLIAATQLSDRPRAVMLTRDEPTPTRDFYRRLGFIDVATGVLLAGSNVSRAVIGAHLPLRAAVTMTAPADD